MNRCGTFRHTIMKQTYYFIFFVAMLAMLPVISKAQDNDGEIEYRRSSLYSIMVSHPEQKMDEEIINAFMKLETPDKYNNHDLSVKCVSTSSKGNSVKSEIDCFLKKNQIAKRLVSKWFNRNKQTGAFDPELIMERGLYDVSVMDVEAATLNKRGIDALADRGYDLIENTFVLVNDITYVDHEANAKVATGILSIIGAVAAVATGDDNNLISSVATLGAMISDMIAGFTVNINSYLYQLEWNDDVADKFYSEYYFDKPLQDSASVADFEANADIKKMKVSYENDSCLFNLKFVGSYKEKSAKPALRGLHSPTDVFRKVCARAIDKNIIALQKKFDQFKVKVPLYGTSPIVAKIGMKEGVSAKSKYEVLLPKMDDKTGRITYTRKGVIKPMPNRIWDNRYMATDENAIGSELNGTEFKIVSGTGFTHGMLIREIK